MQLEWSSLALGDALAVPMYDVFAPTAVNSAPIDGLPVTVNVLDFNTASSPDAEWSTSLALGVPDQVGQATLDQIIWHSVHGAGSQAPPPGPGAVGEDEGELASAAAAD